VSGHDAFEGARHRRILSLGLVGAFFGALVVIELARRGAFGVALAAALPRSHFHAVELAFYLLLAYEVAGLVFATARSVSIAAGKQFEIFSLILLRRSFEAFAGLDEPIRWDQGKDAVLQMLEYAAGALVVFVGLGFYYAAQKHQPLSEDEADRQSFVAAKKAIALLLLAVFGWLAARSLWGLATRLQPVAFFEPFYTVLIFADVLVVLISARYSASYHVVFRNSGLALATVVLRVALAAPPPYIALLGAAATVFLSARISHSGGARGLVGGIRWSVSRRARSIFDGRCDRDGEIERAAAAKSALCPDSSTVCLDDALGGGEPQPRAAAVGSPDLVEPLEQVREVLGGNARARIRHPEEHFLPLRSRADRDAATGRRELERVADEILEHLEKTLAVGEVAAYLRVSTPTVYELCARGELQHTRVLNARIRLANPVWFVLVALSHPHSTNSSLACAASFAALSESRVWTYAAPGSANGAR
jgi:excisionase family DNA binding protein